MTSPTGRSSLPTPPEVSGALPLIGHAVEFARDHLTLFARGYREHGPIFAMRIGPWRFAVVSGIELNALFYKRTDHELRADKAYRYLVAMFGRIGLTATPQRYAAERHTLQAPFKSHRMLAALAVMNEEVREWMAGLGARGSFELVAAVQGLIQRIAAHALMGRDFRDRMSERFWVLYRDLARGLDPVLPPWLPIPKFIRRDRARAGLRAMLGEIIEERRRGGEHQDMLQEIALAELADGTRLSAERAVDYVMALVFAGLETTTAHAAWALIHLLQNPGYRAEVEAELDEVFAGDGEVDAAALRKLERLRLGLQETERLRPVADRNVRYVASEIEAGPYRVPQGWMMMASASITHAIPELYRDPWRYDPHRFERGEGKHPMSLIGFGGGRHKCTGMNFAYQAMTVWLAHLLRDYELELVNRNPRITSAKTALLPEATEVRYRRRRGATQRQSE